jgi:hypothetical protein
MPTRTTVLVAAILTCLVATVPVLWSLGLFEGLGSVEASPQWATAQPEEPTTLFGSAGPPPGSAALVPAPLLRPGPVSVSTPGFWSWSLIDRRTGAISGSANQGSVNVTASMIKAWLAADYLRRAAEKKITPNSAAMSQLSVMIRNSDNAAANTFWRADGGAASIKRLISMCALTDSRAYIDWAHTLMSARDAARMAACIGDGRAAGSRWTEWVLNEMRNVRAGRLGIIQALPPDIAKRTAIKNGWINKSDGKWHINCMAIGDGWTLGVMLVYPLAKGESHGWALCKSITQQLMAKPA